MSKSSQVSLLSPLPSPRELASGFFGGITGVVTKPVQVAQEEGVGGFFKGTKAAHLYQHAARCTLHAARCTLPAARCTLHAARCTLQWLQWLHAAVAAHLYLNNAHVYIHAARRRSGEGRGGPGDPACWRGGRLRQRDF